MAKRKPDPRELRGVLYMHAEQGIEPFLAFQDEKFITPPDPKTGSGTQFSYSGLHMLTDGDVLAICSKTNPKRILWRGTVQLRRPLPHEPTVLRRDLRCLQHGVRPERWICWFSEEYHARLIPKLAKRPR